MGQSTLMERLGFANTDHNAGGQGGFSPQVEVTAPENSAARRVIAGHRIVGPMGRTQFMRKSAVGVLAHACKGLIKPCWLGEPRTLPGHERTAPGRR